MWRDLAADQIVEAFEEVIGRRPCNVWCVRSLCRRFGVRLRGLPPGISPAPFLRGDVIYLPRGHRRTAHGVHWLIHELAHAAMRWDGSAPLVWPAGVPDQHAIARAVEARLLQRHFPDLTHPVRPPASSGRNPQNISR